MALRSQTPVQDDIVSAPQPPDSLSNRGYGRRAGSRPHSFAASSSNYNSAHGAVEPSPLGPYGRIHEALDAFSTRFSLDGNRPAVQRSVSELSHRSATPLRSGTLKKKYSLSKRGSMRRSTSRRSMRAGSVRSLGLGDKEKYAAGGEEDTNSAFFIPVPTSGSPTEVLADRFQAWRKMLKDLIVFFKELQRSYEVRAKLYLSMTNIVNNTTIPPTFLSSGGLGDATEILRDFHKQAHLESIKAGEVESEVINQLVGLRNDLQKKIKEIKALSGDFRNSVDKEVDATRKTVRHLQESLGLVDTDPSATAGKGDPFILRLSVEKQIEKQIEEENYLHRAYLNLENSGRELESIVVGEIQKAYNAYAGILRREAEETMDASEKLRVGPISMPQDHEWNSFIANTDEMVDPRIPLRDVDNITYPGKDHPAAAEVRSGMLERKSKYLKSYAPGWYVLSPTHLHEFKSADRVEYQTPVMSLYLPEQKVGSHSQPDSTSHKFMLKGRQTGPMHRGHSWVFRAESHETMMAWYDDIQGLISTTGEARNAYVRRHVHTISGASYRSSSDGVMEEDEADRTPYSAGSVVMGHERPTSQPREAGGRFPSDVQIDRHQQAAMSPSSEESSEERDLPAAAGLLPDGAPYTDTGSRFYPHERDLNTNTDQGRALNGAAGVGAGGGHRFPIDGYDYQDSTFMSSSDSFNRRNNQLLPEQGPATADNRVMDTTEENPSTNTQFVAGLGSTSSTQNHAAPRQRNRGESASTAFTNSNVTSHTHSTIPTSVDEDPESTDHHDNPKSDKPGVHPDVSTVPNNMHNSIGVPTRPSGPAPTKNSVSTIELRIPGHYPPQQAAA